MKKTNGTITSMKRIISRVKLLMPLSKLVSSLAPTMLFAIEPRNVERPVLNTIPVAVPLATLVPMKQMFFSSVSSLVFPSSRSAYFSTGTDSPSQRGLADGQMLRYQNPKIGRHHIPALSRTISPGTRSASGTSRRSEIRDRAKHGGVRGDHRPAAARPPDSIATPERR